MSGCAHVHAASISPDKLDAAIQAAERACLAGGDRWTAPRRRTYELLLAAGVPVKAYDLIAMYAAKDEPLAKPSTIYRALEFLIGKGLVHRIESLNAFLACSGDHEGKETAFLICDCCGAVEECEARESHPLDKVWGARGFTASRIFLEVQGLCAACAIRGSL